MIIKQGWVEKRRFANIFKKRYVVLTDVYLSYFHTEEYDRSWLESPPLGVAVICLKSVLHISTYQDTIHIDLDQSHLELRCENPGVCSIWAFEIARSRLNYFRLLGVRMPVKSNGHNSIGNMIFGRPTGSVLGALSRTVDNVASHFQMLDDVDSILTAKQVLVLNRLERLLLKENDPHCCFSRHVANAFLDFMCNVVSKKHRNDVAKQLGQGLAIWFHAFDACEEGVLTSPVTAEAKHSFLTLWLETLLTREFKKSCNFSASSMVPVAAAGGTSADSHDAVAPVTNTIKTLKSSNMPFRSDRVEVLTITSYVKTSTQISGLLFNWLAPVLMTVSSDPERFIATVHAPVHTTNANVAGTTDLPTIAVDPTLQTGQLAVKNMNIKYKNNSNWLNDLLRTDATSGDVDESGDALLDYGPVYEPSQPEPQHGITSPVGEYKCGSDVSPQPKCSIDGGLHTQRDLSSIAPVLSSHPPYPVLKEEPSFGPYPVVSAENGSNPLGETAYPVVCPPTEGFEGNGAYPNPAPIEGFQIEGNGAYPNPAWPTPSFLPTSGEYVGGPVPTIVRDLKEELNLSADRNDSIEKEFNAVLVPPVSRPIAEVQECIDSTCGLLCEKLSQSKHLIPSSLVLLFSLLAQLTVNQSSSATNVQLDTREMSEHQKLQRPEYGVYCSSSSALLFLRLICPALISPRDWGALNVPVHYDLQPPPPSCEEIQKGSLSAATNSSDGQMQPAGKRKSFTNAVFPKLHQSKPPSSADENDTTSTGTSIQSHLNSHVTKVSRSLQKLYRRHVVNATTHNDNDVVEGNTPSAPVTDGGGEYDANPSSPDPVGIPVSEVNGERRASLTPWVHLAPVDATPISIPTGTDVPGVCHPRGRGSSAVTLILIAHVLSADKPRSALFDDSVVVNAAAVGSSEGDGELPIDAEEKAVVSSLKTSKHALLDPSPSGTASAQEENGSSMYGLYGCWSGEDSDVPPLLEAIEEVVNAVPLDKVAQLLDLYKESSVRVVQPTTDELVEEKDVRKACLAVAKSLQKVANQACSPEDVLSNNGSNSVTMSQQEMEHDRFQSFSAVSLKKTYAMLGSIDEIMW